jgi:hypothetical protein
MIGKGQAVSFSSKFVVCCRYCSTGGSGGIRRSRDMVEEKILKAEVKFLRAN